MRTRFYRTFNQVTTFVIFCTLALPALTAALPGSEGMPANPVPHEEFPVIDRTGGPDAFGYYFIDSNEPGGPAFSWVNHTTAATTVPVTAWTPNSDNGYAGPYPIPFSFPFYGVSYNQLYLNTNGFVSFGSGSSSVPTTNLPYPGYPAGIFFWAADGNPGQGGTTVRYESFTNPSRFVVTFDSLAYNSMITFGRVFAQIILYPNGKIIVQYLSITGQVTGAVGVQNASGASYLSYGTPAPIGGTAIQFYQPCHQVNNPRPANNTLQVPVTSRFVWTPGSCAINFDVYLSTDSAAVRRLSATARVATRITDTTWTPPVNLAQSTMYFWRIFSRSTSDSVANPVWCFRTFSAGVNGTRTIGGTNPDYPTIHDAIAALNALGTSTGVTFLIRGGTYTELPDSILPTAQTGTNARVVFRPADTNAVIINKQCTVTIPFAFKLVGASYITFDGSPASAPGRRVMTVNAATNYGYNAFWIGNGSSYCSIKNLVATAGGGYSSSAVNPIRGYFLSGGLPNTACSYDTVTNCRIEGGYYGIYLYSTITTTLLSNWYIANNQIIDFYYSAIYLYCTENSTFAFNEISRTGPTGSSSTMGIYSASSQNGNNVFNGNWVYNLYSSSASGTIYGLYMYYGVNKLITNNRIYLDQNGNFTMYGIYLASDRADIINNTIRLSGSGGTTSNSAGIYFSAASTDTLANNIIINTRVGTNATYYNTCFYFGAELPTLPFSYSDYNLMTTINENPTDNLYCARFGASNYHTLSELRAVPGYPCDGRSIQIPPQFISNQDLHIDPLEPTPVESAARFFSRVPKDCDGDLRSTTRPDIGADEGNFFTGSDYYPPRITFTPLNTWGNPTPRVFSAAMNDNTGIARDTARSPRVWYRTAQGTGWNFRRADSTRDTTFFFTIPGYPTGTIIYYYLAVQDTSRNTTTYPDGGRGNNPPGNIPPPNPAFYYVQTPLSGVKTIGGTNPDFRTLNDAVMALNYVGVATGGVTFRIRNGTYNEPGVAITATLTPAQPVVFGIDSGATVVYNLTPSAAGSAGIKLRTQNVTIDGSWRGDVAGKHLTITGNTLSNAICFSDSAQHNTVKNCILEICMQNASAASAVKFGNPSFLPDVPIIGNRLLYCDVSGGYYCLQHYANSTERCDSSIVQYCTFKNFYYYGMYIGYSNGITISHNSIYHTIGTPSTSTIGAYFTSAVNGSLFESNRIGPLLSGLMDPTMANASGFYACGPNVYANNMISLGGTIGGNIYGIYSNASGGKLLFNTVHLTGTTTNASSMAYYNGVSAITAPDTLWGNIFDNLRTGGAGVYHVAIYVMTPGSVNYSDYNLLNVGNEDPTDNRITGRINTNNFNTLADFTASTWGPRDASSFSEFVPFVSDSDLHIQPNVSTAIESGARRHWLVSTDFDNQPRTTPMCDIGADEGNFRRLAFGTICGVVRDSSALRPFMPNVIITAGRYSDTTDVNGYYNMVVRVGTYDVSAAMNCFATNTRTQLRVDSLAVDTVNFDMLHPELSLNPTSVELVGSPGQVRTMVINLQNPGNAPLHWRGNATANQHYLDFHPGGGVRPPVAITIPVKTENTDQKMGESSSDAAPVRTPTPVIDRVWDPDGYGYQAMDNAEPYWPANVQFRDVRGIGATVVNGYNTGAITTMDGMSFTYYGGVYTSLYVNSCGYVQFTTNGVSTPSNTVLPNTSISNGIFVFHDGISTVVSKYYDSTESVFYVQWVGRQYSYAADTVICQLQLHRRINALVFAYNTVIGVHATATIGIQDGYGAGSRYTQCYYNETAPFPIPLNGYMISFNDMSPGGGGSWPSWLSMTPLSGTVASRQSAQFTVRVQIDSNATAPAVWTGNIRLLNDACPANIDIPVSVSVTPNSAPNPTELPYRYKLYQNYPNPFNPSTAIRFDLKQPGFTRLTVYNSLGRRVMELVNQPLPAGYHQVAFDGSKYSSGVYFYRIQSGDFLDVKKMVIMK